MKMSKNDTLQYQCKTMIKDGNIHKFHKQKELFNFEKVYAAPNKSKESQTYNSQCSE